MDLAEVAVLAAPRPRAGIVAGHGRLWGPLDGLAMEADSPAKACALRAGRSTALEGEVKHEAGDGHDRRRACPPVGGDGRFEAHLRGGEAQGR